ncbi:hypothetical protein [Nannocystis bainbridge]|uniref:Uncharacterized protein n=1 Tax=Nannocystis bainbridge TaxID=2995303 RepID=A0ABT5E4X8_9BACT|nr:hypothetical protein [Nannocystis bainbridge]MDC0720922.1 hypothetical protein [Nannocystis bainbridge]
MRRAQTTALSLVLSCGGSGGQTADPPPGPASTFAPSTPAPPSAAPVVAAPVVAAPVVAAPVVALPSTCTAPFIVPPPYHDNFIDDAAATPGHDLGVWPSQPMRGPFATREELQPDCTDRANMTAEPFAEIVHCMTGDGRRPPGPDNLPEHVLLVRTAQGWWAHTLARTRWPHRREDEAQLAHVTQVVAADRLGDGGAEVTAIAQVGPPGGDKIHTAFLCGLGPSGVPACADIRVAAGGPFHGLGAMLYQLTIGCDATLTIVGWEGGSPVKLIHGRATLAFQ